MTAAIADEAPMGTMNTTPLIDVMLVLLIMFIITIPVATHNIPIDLAGDCGADCVTPDLGIVSNKLILSEHDQLYWNGEPISEAQLAAVLAEAKAMPVEPELQFEPSAQASYETSLRTLDIIKLSGVTRFGFVGNERYRDFVGAE